MKILLINPIVKDKIWAGIPRNCSKDIFLFPPLGLMYIEAYLDKFSHHQTKIIDALADNLSYDDITEKDTIFLFQISKYKLSHLIDLKELGIPTDLSDYPKIQELVHELRRLNKESSAIYKKNNTHKKAELKRIKSESPEFQSIKSELDDVLEQIRLLEEKRRNLQVQYTSWVDNTVNEIEKDAGFINPNIRISELNKKLK